MDGGMKNWDSLAANSGQSPAVLVAYTSHTARLTITTTHLPQRLSFFSLATESNLNTLSSTHHPTQLLCHSELARISLVT